MGQGVSLKPSDAVQGGGLYDDLDVTIQKCRFQLWDYQGAIKKAVLGLAVTFSIDEEGGGEFEQVYSAGDTKHFVPSADGREAVRVGNLEGLNENTNAIQFLRSLVDSGFDESKIGSDVSVFEGTRCHVNRKPQPKRPGIKQVEGAKDKDVLIVTQIHAMPGEGKGKGKGKTAGKSGVSASPQAAVAAVAPVAAEANGAVHDKAVETLLGILAAKGGSIKKAAVAGEAFKVLNKAQDPARNAICQLIFKDEFLSGEGVPWAFDGTTISMEG